MVVGKNSALCRFHDLADQSQIVEVTNRLVAHRPIFDLIANMKQMSPIEVAELTVEELSGYPDTKPLDNETPNQWLFRLVDTAGKLIMDNLAKENRVMGGSGVKTSFSMLMHQSSLKAKQ